MTQCGFMARQLVECVPNFSEGRDAAKMDAIVQAILAVPDVVLLDRESDADHNRSVLTFVGPPAGVRRKSEPSDCDRRPIRGRVVRHRAPPGSLARWHPFWRRRALRKNSEH